MAHTTDIQIGPTGALVVLPPPSIGYEMPLTRPRTVRVMLDGGVRVQQAANSARRWVFGWKFPITEADYNTIVDIYEGNLAGGSLPYELHDPKLATTPLVVPVDELGAAAHVIRHVADVQLVLQEVSV